MSAVVSFLLFWPLSHCPTLGISPRPLLSVFPGRALTTSSPLSQLKPPFAIPRLSPFPFRLRFAFRSHALVVCVLVPLMLCLSSSAPLLFSCVFLCSSICCFCFFFLLWFLFYLFFFHLLNDLLVFFTFFYFFFFFVVCRDSFSGAAPPPRLVPPSSLVWSAAFCFLCTLLVSFAFAISLPPGGGGPARLLLSCTHSPSHSHAPTLAPTCATVCCLAPGGAWVPHPLSLRSPSSCVPASGVPLLASAPVLFLALAFVDTLVRLLAFFHVRYWFLTAVFPGRSFSRPSSPSSQLGALSFVRRPFHPLRLATPCRASRSTAVLVSVGCSWVGPAVYAVPTPALHALMLLFSCPPFGSAASAAALPGLSCCRLISPFGVASCSLLALFLPSFPLPTSFFSSPPFPRLRPLLLSFWRFLRLWHGSLSSECFDLTLPCFSPLRRSLLFLLPPLSAFARFPPLPPLITRRRCSSATVVWLLLSSWCTTPLRPSFTVRPHLDFRLRTPALILLCCVVIFWLLFPVPRAHNLSPGPLVLGLLSFPLSWIHLCRLHRAWH